MRNNTYVESPIAILIIRNWYHSITESCHKMRMVVLRLFDNYYELFFGIYATNRTDLRLNLFWTEILSLQQIVGY